MGWIEELKRIKRESGMTIDEIAEKSGVPRSTAAKVLAGIIPNPKVTTLRPLLVAMGKTLDDLEPAEIETAPAQDARELSEKDSQIMAMLPYVPDGVKAGILQILSATIDLAAAAESASRNVNLLTQRREQADADSNMEARNG